MHKRLNYDQSNKFNRIRSKSHSSDEESFNAIREKLKKKPADQKSSKVHPSTETGPSTSAGIFKKISKQTLQEYNNTQRNLKTKFKVSQTVDCIERDPVYYKRHKNLNEDPSKLVIGRRQDEGNKPLFDRTDILVNQKEHDSKRSRSRSTSPERKRKSRSRSFDSESERNRPRQYRKRSRSSSRSSRHSDHHRSNNRKQHRRSHSRSRSSSTPERKPYYLDDKRERERLERERRLRLEGPVRRRTRSRSRERNPPPTHTIVVMPPYGFPGPYSFPPYHYQPQFPPGVAPFPPYPHASHQRMPPQRFPPSHPGMMPRPHFDPNMPRPPPHFDPNMPRPPPFHGFPPRFPQRPRFPPQNQRFRHPRPQGPQGPNPRMQYPNNRGKKRK